MAQPPHSQLAPLPTNLPFDLVSETLGRGAYAFVRKGKDPGSGTVCAVKFIHKQYSEKYGNITPKQLLMEVGLHQHVGAHKNVIQFYASGESTIWRWIAMEFADGGDLFDKIEADVGVQDDIAHYYFRQLLAGTEFIHTKGVAHRDIKPENILLDSNGDLKIADFGFATLFKHKNQVKKSTQLVGSPPYVAPEVSAGRGYIGDQVDVWSCGVVLFVLLTGNTPWDEPTSRSPEYVQYKSTGGNATYEPWPSVKPAVRPLIQAMMEIDPAKRYTVDQIKSHPWYRTNNPLLSVDSRARGIMLATRLVEGLKVPLTQVAATPEDDNDGDGDDEDDDMEYEEEDTIVADDIDAFNENISSSATVQPEPSSSAATDIIPNTQALSDDMESLTLDPADVNPELSSQQPSQYLRDKAANAAQNFAANQRRHQYHSQQSSFSSYNYNDQQILESVNEDPSQSQFSAQPAVPLTLTQAARQFNDICPAGRLTRFYTLWPYSRLLPLLLSSLRKSGVPVDERCYDENVEELENQGDTAKIKLKARDSRQCILTGSLGIERVTSAEGDGLYVIGFEKARGCPLEWRRLFKRVSLLCQEAVFRGRGLG
ncbi:Chk1 protein kinase [Arthrobotrys musiformis]|uniref:non-specific serine/threonine protein kinase n=1 Tax=Arthrobotrys musiformis TaxID=47236 RepID=A0AAV9VU92_9PEZI